MNIIIIENIFEKLNPVFECSNCCERLNNNPDSKLRICKPCGKFYCEDCSIKFLWYCKICEVEYCFFKCTDSKFNRCMKCTKEGCDKCLLFPIQDDDFIVCKKCN